MKFLNEEMKGIMKIVNSLEEMDLLMQGVSQTVEYEAKKTKREFLGMIIGTLGASLLENLLAGKPVIYLK